MLKRYHDAQWCKENTLYSPISSRQFQPKYWENLDQNYDFTTIYKIIIHIFKQVLVNKHAVNYCLLSHMDANIPYLYKVTSCIKIKGNGYTW